MEYTQKQIKEEAQTAIDGIPEEARAKGAGIAPLHPYAQWDKDHPQKKQSGIKWTTEDLKRAELLGRNAYHKSINAPCQDKKMMDMLKGAEVGDGIKPMKAWVEGWTKERLNTPREATA